MKKKYSQRRNSQQGPSRCVVVSCAIVIIGTLAVAGRYYFDSLALLDDPMPPEKTRTDNSVDQGWGNDPESDSLIGKSASQRTTQAADPNWPNEVAELTTSSDTSSYSHTVMDEIPGSLVSGADMVKRLHKHLTCISHSGSWEFIETPKLLPWNRLGDAESGVCDAFHERNEDGIAGKEADDVALSAEQDAKWSVRTALKWEWKTQIWCPTIPFVKHNFCKIVGKQRNILIVGDPISRQLYESLLNNIVAPGPEATAFKANPEMELCADEMNAGFRLYWARNDFVSLERHPAFGPATRVEPLDPARQKWEHIIEDKDIKILILNRGANYVQDDAFLTQLRATVKTIRSRHPNLLVIFRSTYQGHMQCSEHMDELLWEPQPEKGLPNKWDEIPRQNQLAAQVMEEFGGVYMDVEAIMRMRADGHRANLVTPEDCVRYCLPGPVDAWTTLLMNILHHLEHMPGGHGVGRRAGIDEDDEPLMDTMSVTSREGGLWRDRSYAHEVMPSIPGSGISTIEGRKKLDQYLACFGETGQWRPSNEPHYLPWNNFGDARSSTCDQTWIQTSDGVAGRLADDLTEEWIERSEGDRSALDKWNVRPPLKWEWKSQLWCPFTRFMREDFCRSVGKDRNILLVGDTLQRQFYDSLLNHLRPASPQKEDGKGWQVCEDVVGGSGFLIHYVRNDVLSVGVNSQYAEEGEQSWEPLINELDIQVLILGRSSGSAVEEKFFLDLRSTLSSLRRVHTDLFIIFRSVSPGHLGCEHMKQPLKEFQDLDRLPLSLNKNAINLNRIAFQVMEEFGGVLLPVETMTALRIDGHRSDCLHYCLPGPPDAWTQMLSNLFHHLSLHADDETAQSGAGKGTEEVQVRLGLDGTYEHKAAESIPGTDVKGADKVQSVGEYLHCLAKRGSWLKYREPRKLPWNRMGNNASSICDATWTSSGAGIAGGAADGIQDATKWNVRAALKWEWVSPTNCPFKPFVRADFCKAVGSGNNILIVGDEVQEQLYDSLLNHLIPSTEWKRNTAREGYSLCKDLLVGDGVRIQYVRNDFLSVAGVAEHDRRTLTDAGAQEDPWLPLIAEGNVKILILNRGTHYVDDKAYLRELHATLRAVRKQHPDLLIIFRATPPGHLRCTKETGPFVQPQHAHHLPNNWGQFGDQNRIAAQVMEEFGGIYMDVEKMTSLRPDGHRAQVRGGDCLNYCLPGPPDTWSQLLFNTLSFLKTAI